MIKMIQGIFDKEACKADLVAFKQLLDKQDEYDEKTLYNFFIEHPNLILLIGKMGFNYSPHFYQNEFNFFNEFYADFAVSNKKKSSFIFIEFEDAKRDSIFKEFENLKTTRHEWSEKYEHGYSQIINWFYRLDDYSKDIKFKEHFGTDKLTYQGMLIIGRNKFIQQAGLRSRLDWRNEKVSVNQKQIFCCTYDDLYDDLKEKLEILLEDDTNDNLNEIFENVMDEK